MANPYVMQTGPLPMQLVGTLFAFFLNGVFAAQLCFYYSKVASNDPSGFVYLVWAVALLEILHLIFSAHMVYAINVAGFGDSNALIQSPWSGAALPALNGFVGLCTQIFFAWRIHRLGPHTLTKVIAAFVALTALLQCAAAIGVAVQFTLLSRNIQLITTLKNTVTVWLAGSVTCDVVISATIVAVLSRRRLGLNYASSKRVVDRIIRHTIENGLVTTVCALVTLVSFLTLHESWLYICFEVLLGRLYANVLLVALNGRENIDVNGAGETLDFHCTFMDSSNEADTRSHDGQSCSYSCTDKI